MTTDLRRTPHALLSAVGTDLGTTDRITITQDQIDKFAEATLDHQWIHCDVERAKHGPFGAPIAHGYLTMSLASHFLAELVRVEGISMGINYGTEKVRFPAPVPVGSQLRGRGELIDAKEVPGGVQATTRITIEREGVRQARRDRRHRLAVPRMSDRSLTRCRSTRSGSTARPRSSPAPAAASAPRSLAPSPTPAPTSCSRRARRSSSTRSPTTCAASAGARS